MQGFQKALNEYEARMFDPFADEEKPNYDDYDWDALYEESLLERQVEDYIRG